MYSVHVIREIPTVEIAGHLEYRVQIGGLGGLYRMVERGKCEDYQYNPWKMIHCVCRKCNLRYPLFSSVYNQCIIHCS